MDIASRTVADVELEGYFVAALGFIDPALTTDAPLEVVEAAAARRQQSLASLPAQIAEADLAQLTEALDFIRRSYGKVPHQHAEPTVVVATDVEPVPDNVITETAANGHAIFEVADLDLPTPTVNGNGNGHHASVPTASTVEYIEEESIIPRRRSPLSRLWEEAEKNEDRADDLPESKALPLVRGALLLAYEAWLALFAGWVATRLMVWPHPNLGYEVSPIYGHFISLVGIATAAVAAWVVWRYRTVTHRFAALVHAGAVLVLFDLMRWRMTANEIPKFDAPGPYLWEAFFVCWVAVAVMAHLNDLRAR